MVWRPRAGPYADLIEPCHPTLVAKPPAGPGWLHEIKHDGFRMFAGRDGERVRLITRNGFDWAARYPLVVKAVAALKARSCLIDGEITVCDGNGVAVFDLLRHGPREKTDVVLYAFDLLELDDEDLRRQPIEERKRLLAKLLRKANPSLQLMEHIEAEGAIVFNHACKLGAEGIVSKRVGSRYVAGRTDKWVKTKNPEAPAVRRLEEEDWNG
jgi:bifunctional non-homologous end joining protein LigD